MTSTALQSYRYRSSSALADGRLLLSTSGSHPRFFTGFLTAPAPTAAGLLALADVARANYLQPVRVTYRDPIVTGHADGLRFESVSGCCGVYARLDVPAAALDGELPEHGTTNVDVNQPLYTALSRVGAGDPLRLSVGPDGGAPAAAHAGRLTGWLGWAGGCRGGGRSGAEAVRDHGGR